MVDTSTTLLTYFCLQPYNSVTSLDVEFPRQAPIWSDNIAMIDQGPNAFSMPRSSNPFTLQLTTCTVSCSCVIEGSSLERVQFMEAIDLNC